MKKFVKGLSMMLLVCMLLVVTACGNSEKSTNSAATDAPKENKQVTLKFWTISLKPTFDAYINKLIAAYESEHANIKIDWQDYPLDAIQTKLLATAAGNDAPDVVNLNTELATQLVSIGALADLNGHISDQVKSEYFDGIFNATVIDGKAYALPWYTSTQVLYMNKNLLAKAGLDASKPPVTREEMHAMARTIKEKTGAGGYATQFTAKANLANEGVAILSADRKAAGFNGPEGVAVINEMKQLVNDGIVMKSIANFDAQVQYFASEQVAFMLSGPTFINKIKTAAPDVYKNTVAVPLPKGKGNSIYSNSMNMIVPKGSQNVKEAAEFAAYITNPANQLEFSKVANTLPSTKKTIEDPFFSQSDNSLEAQAKIASANGLKFADEYTLGVPKVKDINDAIARELEKILLNNADVKASLDAAANEVNKSLK